MTSIQSGMGIGVTQSIPLVDIGALRGSQSRRKEIEGGQLEMKNKPSHIPANLQPFPTLEELLTEAQRWAQGDKEMRLEKKLTSLTVNGVTYKLVPPDETSDRYTKDLENILRKILECGKGWPEVCSECLTEAKALLERPK